VPADAAAAVGAAAARCAVALSIARWERATGAHPVLGLEAPDPAPGPAARAPGAVPLLACLLAAAPRQRRAGGCNPDADSGVPGEGELAAVAAADAAQAVLYTLLRQGFRRRAAPAGGTGGAGGAAAPGPAAHPGKGPAAAHGPGAAAGAQPRPGPAPAPANPNPAQAPPGGAVTVAQRLATARAALDAAAAMLPACAAPRLDGRAGGRGREPGLVRLHPAAVGALAARAYVLCQGRPAAALALLAASVLPPPPGQSRAAPQGPRPGGASGGPAAGAPAPRPARGSEQSSGASSSSGSRSGSGSGSESGSESGRRRSESAPPASVPRRPRQTRTPPLRRSRSRSRSRSCSRSRLYTDPRGGLRARSPVRRMDSRGGRGGRRGRGRSPVGSPPRRRRRSRSASRSRLRSRSRDARAGARGRGPRARPISSGPLGGRRRPATPPPLRRSERVRDRRSRSRSRSRSRAAGRGRRRRSRSRSGPRARPASTPPRRLSRSSSASGA